MIRVRLYKRFPTGLGVAELTLLDVPLRPTDWKPADDKALDALEQILTRRRPS